MTKPLVVRLPKELHQQLKVLQATLCKQTGGVEPDFSKVVRHVLQVGLGTLAKKAGTDD